MKTKRNRKKNSTLLFFNSLCQTFSLPGCLSCDQDIFFGHVAWGNFTGQEMNLCHRGDNPRSLTRSPGNSRTFPKKKKTLGVPLWRSGLRIQRGHHCGVTSPSSPALQPLIYFLYLWICLFRTFHMNRIRQYMVFCGWLLSLSMLSCCSTCLFSFLWPITLHYIRYTTFCLSMHQLIGCFHFGGYDE